MGGEKKNEDFPRSIETNDESYLTFEIYFSLIHRSTSDDNSNSLTARHVLERSFLIKKKKKKKKSTQKLKANKKKNMNEYWHDFFDSFT